MAKESTLPRNSALGRGPQRKSWWSTRIRRSGLPSSGRPKSFVAAASSLFRTETVYGLGADALSSEAVERIFQAKGRPANNPLIVHVASAAGASEVCDVWPDEARRLADAFWPGPLSIVLPKRSVVPHVVTAGRSTVAVRVPAAQVALALVQSAGRPVAAPSANRSNRISPTRAEHVLASLAGRVELVLDGGPCVGGLESTVIDLSGLVAREADPVILRPGLVSRADLERVLDREVRIASETTAEEHKGLPSPGMMSRHYAPEVPLHCANEPGGRDGPPLVQTRRTTRMALFRKRTSSHARERRTHRDADGRGRLLERTLRGHYTCWKVPM